MSITLGMLDTEKLWQIAADLVEHEVDAPELWEIVYLEKRELSTDTVKAPFEQFFQHRGLTTMSREDLLRLYAREVSRQIQIAQVSPYQGARLIWAVTSKMPIPNFHELDSFIYAASEMQDRPEDQSFFENAILAEAKRWVSQ